jgi:hypothetical protein
VGGAGSQISNGLIALQSASDWQVESGARQMPQPANPPGDTHSKKPALHSCDERQHCGACAQSTAGQACGGSASARQPAKLGVQLHAKQ